MELTSFRTLGRSGLAISPMALGTMTFGTARWGTTADDSHAILNAYVNVGGNFIDTADIYASGRSEEIIGEYVADRKLRDALVLATKFTWNQQPGNPNAGGNGRKNIYRALDASLRRLRTDHIDLYWLHFWDMVTPVAEVLQTLGDLVRAGKIRYFALSDVPAWYATKMAVLAEQQGVPGPIALQMEYSLVERTLEQEHLPAARDCGLGIMPWSPLAGGFLSGKYTRHEGGTGDTHEGRLNGNNPFGQSKFTEKNWQVLSVLNEVAAETTHSPAQVALAWTLQKSGVSSVLLGASKVDQVHSNLVAMEVALTPKQISRLDQASALGAAFPYSSFTPDIRRAIFGGQDVIACE
jgi:aryl-alcohol dehydrogenase-like predicted oxidoreductase